MAELGEISKILVYVSRYLLLIEGPDIRCPSPPEVINIEIYRFLDGFVL